MAHYERPNKYQRPDLVNVFGQLGRWTDAHTGFINQIWNEDFTNLESKVNHLFWVVYKYTQSQLELIGYVNEFTDNLLDAFDSLDDEFRDLYTFVHDYFDNLDVQEEVNNKVMELVEDGTLASLINQDLFQQLNARLTAEETNRLNADNALQAQIDGIVGASGGTDIIEVVNARTDQLGDTYGTLKARIDSEVSGLIPKENNDWGSARFNMNTFNVTVINRGAKMEYSTLSTAEGNPQFGLFSRYPETYDTLISTGRTRFLLAINSQVSEGFTIGITAQSGNWSNGVTIGNVVVGERTNFSTLFEINLNDSRIVNFYNTAERREFTVWIRTTYTLPVDKANTVYEYIYEAKQEGEIGYKYASRSDLSIHSLYAETSSYADVAGSNLDLITNYTLQRHGSTAEDEFYYDLTDGWATLSFGLNKIKSWSFYAYNQVTNDVLSVIDRTLNIVIRNYDSSMVPGTTAFRIGLSANSQWGAGSNYIDLSQYLTLDSDINGYTVSVQLSSILPATYTTNLFIICGWTYGESTGDGLYDQYGSLTVGSGFNNSNSYFVADRLKGFDSNDYYDKSEINDIINNSQILDENIYCWGDSLTAQGGWITTLSQLSGRTVIPYAVGGEGVSTIANRQGANKLIIPADRGVVIPASTTPVTLATYAQGFNQSWGSGIARPWLQGIGGSNPVVIDGISGNIAWTGASYNDPTGTWTFTRLTAGNELSITRPTQIVSNSDLVGNKDIVVIWVGTNGYPYTSDVAREQLRDRILLMVEHTKTYRSKCVIMGVLRGSQNNADDVATDDILTSEFGVNYLRMREYFSTPIYNTSGEIISCYGLEEAGLTATSEDITAIQNREVPPQLFTDGVHLTPTFRTVVGNYLYKQMRNLNLFN